EACADFVEDQTDRVGRFGLMLRGEALDEKERLADRELVKIGQGKGEREKRRKGEGCVCIVGRLSFSPILLFPLSKHRDDDAVKQSLRLEPFPLALWTSRVGAI